MHIILADSQTKVRSALRLLLEQQAEEYTVDEAATLAELVKLAGNSPVDVLLIDWKLLGPVPDKVIAIIHELFPGLFIITTDSNPQTGKIALKEGADSFVSKYDPPERLLEAIRQCLEDGTMNRQKDAEVIQSEMVQWGKDTGINNKS